MPRFILEVPKIKPGNERPNLRIMYTKNSYDKRVKITDWERERESYPRDNNPYEPHAINLHLASYNRLGNNPDEQYTTSTRIMLQQIYDKENYVIPNSNKYLVNYYAYNGIETCFNNEKDEPYCIDYPNDYITTMQKDYSPPKPFIMNRISIPYIPPGRYKKFKWTDPYNAETKFWDDKLQEQICRQQIRKKTNISAVKSINEL